MSGLFEAPRRAPQILSRRVELVRTHALRARCGTIAGRAQVGRRQRILSSAWR